MSKLLKQYHDPANPGGYGGLSRFTKSQGISLKKAKSVLEHDFGVYATQTDQTQVSNPPCQSVYHRRTVDRGPD